MVQWAAYAAHYLRLEGGLLGDLLTASTAVLHQEGMKSFPHPTPHTSRT